MAESIIRMKILPGLPFRHFTLLHHLFIFLTTANKHTNGAVRKANKIKLLHQKV
jgi:hypothetical protein